jgi:hypothetical protein
MATAHIRILRSLTARPAVAARVCCALGAGGHAIGALCHHAKAKVVERLREDGVQHTRPQVAQMLREMTEPVAGRAGGQEAEAGPSAHGRVSATLARVRLLLSPSFATNG